VSCLVITGGCGSLGRAVLREQALLTENKIETIRVFSRDEAKHEKLEREYIGDIKLRCLLGDVSDSSRTDLSHRDAHHVIHGAANKIIARFESDVPTGIKTNVTGTQNVRDSFLKSKNAVSGIFISSDKAMNPTTAYGASKLLAEHAWLFGNSYQKRATLSVARYGNCFGSNQSIISIWSKLAQQQKTLPLTDEKMTRFFITLKEAARFVLKNLFYPHPRVNIPVMRSCSMLNLAEVIYKFHNPQVREVPLKIIGRWKNEKLHEEICEGWFDSEHAPRYSDHELEYMYKQWLIDKE